MCALLLGVLLFVGYSHAGDVARCTNGTETTMTFTPYNDGVVGRYLAEWCINVNPMSLRPTAWTLQLKFFRKNNFCKRPPTTSIYDQGKTHSWFQDSIEINNTCTHVCLNTTVDLIFSACYLMKTSFLVNNVHRNITDRFIYVDNKYTEEEFKNNTAQVNAVCHDGENVTSEWHTGVPFQSFYLDLWEKVTSSLNETRLVKVQESPDCSAPSDTEVKCYMRLWPGVFHTQLRLHAPWKHGVFRDQDVVTYDIVVPSAEVTEVTAWSSWPWALGALVAVVVFGFAMLCACRSREARALRKKTLENLFPQQKEELPVVVRPQTRYILLLYAREGHLGDEFCAALKNMLSEHPDVKVYDIFSVEVMSLAASAPNAWIRAMLEQPDVSVLLVQTPAVAALYQRHLNDSDSAVRLQEPLLGRRLLYREPQYGDTLLQYALMLIMESASSWNNYDKYYVADLAELPTEIFPHLVPYKRFPLPGAAPLLANAICGLTPSQRALNELSVAARTFVDRATDDPGYLLELLIELP